MSLGPFSTHGQNWHRCPKCGYEELLRPLWVSIPVHMRTSAWETERKITPPCPTCGVGMEFTPKPSDGGGFDVLPDGFEVDGETIGRGPGRVRLSSLQEIRTIERESEQRHRNGEGQIVAFRDFNQDRGNKLTNSFTGSGYETGRSRLPERRRTIKRDLPITVRPTSGS